MARLFTGLVGSGSSSDQYFVAASTLSVGELVYFDSSGEADLADATAGAGYTYHARGVVIVGAAVARRPRSDSKGSKKSCLLRHHRRRITESRCISHPQPGKQP